MERDREKGKWLREIERRESGCERGGGRGCKREGNGVLDGVAKTCCFTLNVGIPSMAFVCRPVWCRDVMQSISGR